jgi:hypothetical protein
MDAGMDRLPAVRISEACSPAEGDWGIKITTNILYKFNFKMCPCIYSMALNQKKIVTS